MVEIKKNVITIDKKQFEYAVKGTKGPTVLLINGAGGPLESWMRVWEQIGQDNRVFAYNRLGIGNSSKPDEPQNGIVMAKDLKDLLAGLKLEAPYVVVGHSLGGFVAQLFATIYGEAVHGLVLIESSTVKDVLNNSKKKKETNPNDFSEVSHVLTTIKQIQESETFPNIPITIIAGSKPAFGWLMPRKIKEARLNNQKELVNLSDKGRLVIATKSGHFPQMTEPKLVIDEINKLLVEVSAK